MLLVLAACAGPCALAQRAPGFDDLAQRAAAARDQQDIPAAIDLYARAVQAKPDWTEGWWYLTLLQYGANRYPGTIDAANHLLQLEPHAVPALTLRGLSEFEVADYPGALRDLETAVQHGAANDPHNEQIVRYHLALALARAERFQDALDQYKVFAQEGVSSSDVLVGIGLAGMQATAFPSEIGERDRLIYLTAGKAGYAFLTGDSQLAETLFQQAFADHPGTANLHLFYGLLLFTHNAMLAAEQFQREVALVPGDGATRALLAYTLVIAGHYQEALPEAQRAYALAPELQMAQIALGRSFGETGDIEHGAQLLAKVLERDPDNLEAHLGLAALFSRAGKREDAYRERMVCLKLAK